jgi:hypothetical protein
MSGVARLTTREVSLLRLDGDLLTVTSGHPV